MTILATLGISVLIVGVIAAAIYRDAMSDLHQQ